MSRGGVSYSSTHGLGSSVMDGGYGEEKEKGACRSQTHEPAQGFSLSLPPPQENKKKKIGWPPSSSSLFVCCVLSI